MRFTFTIIFVFCFTVLYARNNPTIILDSVEKSVNIDSTKSNRIILLDEINITAKKDHSMDSIYFRKQYASVFNANKPYWKDLFSSKNYFDNTPLPYNRAASSTASIVSINLLSLVNLVGKNKSPITKLQKILLQEEREKYLDHVFSSEKVQKITGLQGDSLFLFIQRYRPNKEELTKMSEYDILTHIKESFKDYRAPRK